jgi:hypothetical protein
VSTVTITIEPNTEHNNYYLVRCGDRYIDQLGKDEALWVVANLLMLGHGEQCFGGLLTAEEHAQRDARLAEIRARPPEPAIEPVPAQACMHSWVMDLHSNRPSCRHCGTTGDE